MMLGDILFIHRRRGDSILISAIAVLTVPIPTLPIPTYRLRVE